MEKSIYLIVGLGNPDKKYEGTRHNIGFMVIDSFCKKENISLNINDFFAMYNKVKLFDKDVIIAKPMTYMNNSGISVFEIVKFFKIKTENILIIHDDLDLNVGELRLKPKGSSGGHNGLKSIFTNLQSEDIKRIKIGIGKPKYNTIDHVLTKFDKDEKVLIDEAIDKASDAIIYYLQNNFDLCMSKYNHKEKKVEDGSKWI